MGALSQASRVLAKDCRVQMVSGNSDSDQMDSGEKGWFSELAHSLLADVDAGFALHLLTGFEDRTCYRYAAGDRKPPGYFIRALLRSEQGETWLTALMDGAEPKWWIALQTDRRKAALFDQAQAIFAQIDLATLANSGLPYSERTGRRPNQGGWP